MPLRREKTFDPLPLVVGFVTLLLLVLGALQYRWTGDLSLAERAQMRAGLEARARQLAQDFDREITRALLWLQVDAKALDEPKDPEYAARYDRWRARAPEPGLLKDAYIAELAPSGPRLLRYDPEARGFVASAWPPGLASARDAVLRGPGFSPGRPGPGPDPRPETERGRERGPGPGPFRPGPLHLLDDGTPVLVAPAPSFDRSAAPPGPVFSIRMMRLTAATILVLDPEVLAQKLLPQLARRYFASTGGEPEFALTVTRHDRAQDVLFRVPEDGPFPDTADARVPFFALRFDEALEEDLRGVTTPFTAAVLPERRPPPRGDRRMGFPGRMLRGERDEDAGLWSLAVAYREGSVDALVAGARRRNLIVSFSVLLLLGTSTLLLFAAARRARRTAERQMEFVAAVSHELRTPVSVICSAGENLADGVVEGRDNVGRYGALVRDEGRRLARVLEQVLDFAGTYTGQRRYRREPVAVESVVDEALAAAAPALREAGTRASREVAADLPVVLGDGPALARAVRNLVENAVKYGGEDKVVSVRATRRERGGQPWVRIEVEDHGLGIPEAEQKHLFEPFFRGDEATSRQIRGSGLGLALVRSIARAHGGEIAVTSAPGAGSVFTLELPGAKAPAETSGARHESTHDDIAHPAG